jgi:chemotaxis protein histidine kinase CheA
MNDFWWVTVIALGLAFWAPIASVYFVRRWRRASKARRRRHRVDELVAARARLAQMQETLSNKSWPPAGSRRRAAMAPGRVSPAEMREHLALLLEATSRLQADLARGLELAEIANRVERLHRHHVHVLDLIDSTRS